MQSTLGSFQETKSESAFALQNSKLLKVSLDQITIQAKLGSMVAYQGDVHFEHAGSGGLNRMMKKALTGENIKLMKVSGSGELFLANLAEDVHLKTFIGKGSGEGIQLGFAGPGWVLVQPSEGRVKAEVGNSGGGSGGGIGGMLGNLTG